MRALLESPGTERMAWTWTCWYILGIMGVAVFNLGVALRDPPPLPEDGSPLKVTFRLSVVTVSPIQSNELEFRANMRVKMEWRDPRIEPGEDCDFVSADRINSIWIPDLFISNSKYVGIKSFGRQLMDIRIVEDDTNNTVQLSFVMNATVACQMDFHYYPADIQLCPLIMQSYGYSSDEIQLLWATDGDAFRIKPGRLIQFEIVDSPPPQSHLILDADLGNVSTLIAIFRFERLIGSHVVQTFIPCYLVVALSWCSFWLELDVTAARGFLLMTSMLTLVTQLGSLRSELPAVAYVKMVDVWIFGCMLSIYFALAEFVIVKVIYSVTEEVRKSNLVLEIGGMKKGQTRQKEVKGVKSKKRLGSVVLSGRSIATEDLPALNKTVLGKEFSLIWIHEGKDQQNNRERRSVLWRKIDRICRWAFPLIFDIFCVIYWSLLIGLRNRTIDQQMDNI